MSGTTVEIETRDGTADAYLARPEDDSRHPGVLLLIDAYGLRPQIERMADRIAEQGYVVLAPNLFYRHARGDLVPGIDLKDPDQRGAAFEKVKPLVFGLTPDLVARDAEAYLDRLAQETDGPVGLTGYCMGGRVGWTIAATRPDRVAALGCFHTGGLVTGREDSPHLRAPEIDAELYFGHADNDRSMTPENIAALNQALDEAGKTYRAEVYTGAEHGYTMADTAAYDEAAAERHYQALFSLLDRAVAAA